MLFLVERDVRGNLLDEARCELCNENSPVFSVPDSSGDRYVPWVCVSDIGCRFDFTILFVASCQCICIITFSVIYLSSLMQRFRQVNSIQQIEQVFKEMFLYIYNNVNLWY